MILIKQFFISFLGLDDKKQKIKSEQVATYVSGKKYNFTKEMIRIQKQAKTVHQQTRQAHVESAKLFTMVDDITSKIAVVTMTKK